MEFLKIKNIYNEARTKERNKISKFLLKQSDFEKVYAKSGAKNYKSGGKLAEGYDLSNWKWVCAKKDGMNFFISLQTFDRDYRTGNPHILMDRIGIYAHVGEYSSADIQEKMIITNIELPLNESKLNELAELLRDLSKSNI